MPHDTGKSWQTVLSSGLPIASKKPRTAVIFAGGKSSRMEQDKALLPFGGFPTLAQFQFQRLQALFDDVYIAAKTNKFTFDVPIIEDIKETASPMVGLVSIWDQVDADEIFVISVDLPFVTSEVIEKLYGKAEQNQADVIVARSPNGLEPLCAIYRRSSSKVIQQLLIQDNHKLQYLLQRLDTVEVNFEKTEWFMNLNYPSDYQKALEYLIRF
ncbi:MAG: molybdenum cofactor guanylyltransferase MobA [Campylobacterales bacterium]|nr:molybdenum cofactor guanylyltransferase MobA [Campylobacterales bacterium]